MKICMEVVIREGGGGREKVKEGKRLLLYRKWHIMKSVTLWRHNHSAGMTLGQKGACFSTKKNVDNWRKGLRGSAWCETERKANYVQHATSRKMSVFLRE